MRISLCILMALLLSCSVGAVGTKLEYSLSHFDSDNNGLEGPNGIIDFTVKSSNVQGVQETNLCTWWNVYNQVSSLSTSTCYGSSLCCDMLGVSHLADTSWDETFFLFTGKLNSGTKNKVSANVAVLEQGMGIFTADYGGWSTLGAIFSDESPEINMGELNISIRSPNNLTFLSSGENVFLNFTTNLSVTANYSLDLVKYSLGTGTSFSTFLQGTLNSILSNGQHFIAINLSALNQTFIANYTFSVNDSSAPTLNYSSIPTLVISEHAQLQINFTSSELTNLSYHLSAASTGNFILARNSSVLMNLSMLNGSNTLLLNATDVHGNKAETQVRFNFTQNVSNLFAALPDKFAYNTSEQILVLVNAPLNSTYNITIYGQDYYQKTSFASSGAVTYFFSLSSSGNYTINVSFGYKEIGKTISTPIRISSQYNSSLTATISANITTPDEGANILFTPIYSGNASNVSFRWDFNGDGTTDSFNQSAIYNYSSNKTYIVFLNATDGIANSSSQISIYVRKKNNVTIMVRHNLSSELIENSAVTFDGQKLNTSSNGTLIFQKYDGTYSLDVSHPNFISVSSNPDVSSNSTIEIFLRPLPSRSVMISGDIEPSNSSVFVKFSVQAFSNLTCSLQSNLSTNWKSVVTKRVDNGSNDVMELQNLSDGIVYVRLRCSDEFGNDNFTTQEVVVNTTSGIVELTKKVDVWLLEIEAAKRTVSENEELVNLMQLDKELESSKFALNRAKRDLFDLSWRKLTAFEKENMTGAILNDAEKARNSTISKVSIRNSKDFVAYPKRTSVDEASAKFLSFKKAKLSEVQRKEYSKITNELQSQVTASTEVKQVEVSFLSGDKRVYTLVRKSIVVKDNSSDTILVELIPKSIAPDIGHIKILTDHDVIDPDPLIQVSKGEKVIAYYAKKELDLDLAKDSSTLLMYKEFDSSSGSAITGFMVATGLDGLASNAKKRLMAEVIVVVILVLVYFAYSKNLMFFTKKESPAAKIIQDATAKASLGDYDAAKAEYAKLRELYPKLPEKERASVKPKIAEVCDAVNLCFVKKKVAEGKQLAGSGKLQEAKEIYKSISPVYNSISQKFKADVYSSCEELHKLLSGAK